MVLLLARHLAALLRARARARIPRGVHGELDLALCEGEAPVRPPPPLGRAALAASPVHHAQVDRQLEPPPVHEVQVEEVVEADEEDELAARPWRAPRPGSRARLRVIAALPVRPAAVHGSLVRNHQVLTS